MKRIYKPFALLLSALLLFSSCYQKQTLDYSRWYTVEEQGETPDPETIEGLFIMSSNVRFYSARNKADDPDTGDRDWEVRKKGYFEMVNTMQPQVIGLQEAEMNQVSDIVTNCKGYSYKGVGRKNGAQDGESTAIIYKANEIQVEDWGTVWLSDTPTVVASHFTEMTDNQCRTATWAILKVKETGRKFFYLNTHTSLFEASQPKEVACILNTVTQHCPDGLPVVLSADWNLEETDPIMAPVFRDYASARQTAELTDNIETFHWWGSQSTISKHQHLDHIFYSGFEKCLRFRTLNMKWKNLWISDHHPVYAILQFKSGGEGHQAPVADFEIPANPMMDETIKFLDKSTSEEGIESWSWNIGGILSSEQNPEVVFNTFGDNIPVSLTVTYSYGEKASVTKTFSVARSEGHNVSLAWSRAYEDTEGAWVNWTSPALNAAGDRIYVTSSGNHLVCFDPSGNQVGTYDIGENEPYPGDMKAVRTTPSVDRNGDVYVQVQYGWNPEESGPGSGGLYSIKPNCAGKNWYCDAGHRSQFEYTIPAIMDDYVTILLRGNGAAISGNMSLVKKQDGTEYMSLIPDGGSYGGLAVGQNKRFVFSAITIASTGLGSGFKVAIPNGTGWETTPNSNDGRRKNLLSGDGIAAKGCQPAISSRDGSVYLCSSLADGEKFTCARYDLNSYSLGVAPTALWRVEFPAVNLPNHSVKHGIGFGCALDADGNAYYMAGDKVFRLNGDSGEKAWEHSFQNGGVGVPALDALGYLYFLDVKGHKLVKLSSADGKVISELELGDNVVPSSSPTIGPDGSIYFNANVDDVPTLYKVTCPKTTAPGANWSQLGGNYRKTCNVADL